MARHGEKLWFGILVAALSPFFKLGQQLIATLISCDLLFFCPFHKKNIFTENNTPFYIKLSGTDIVSEIIDDFFVNFIVNNHDSIPNHYLSTRSNDLLSQSTGFKNYCLQTPRHHFIFFRHYLIIID